MSDMQTWLEMGGYARFIWPAYLAAALVLGVLAIASVCRLRRLHRALARLESETERAR
ncbi:MAG: heme exporter protein CcmD [Rhodospirillaceae bacterium]|nr:heme exporter protein CcmD [Rhodospirillaceae bacterium]